MNKLSIFVCENFMVEYKKIIEKDGFDDVNLNIFPCICENKLNLSKSGNLLQESLDDEDSGVIFCSKYCDIVNVVPQEPFFKIIQSNYCFSHMVNEDILDYILDKGGYVIGSGWLNNWQEHIKSMGFDHKTANLFYHEVCDELVFFDSGIDSDCSRKLEELATFLNLPYRIITYNIELLELRLKNIVCKWKLGKLNKINDKNRKVTSEVQAKCAEYEAILDVLCKIASCKNKRAALDKIKEIFIVIMGAKEFRFHTIKSDSESIPDIVKQLLDDYRKKTILLVEKNMFYVVINNKGTLHGVIEVSDFIFPQYIPRYLDFATSISEVLGLVLNNIENYEELIRQKNEIDKVYNILDKEMQNAQYAYHCLVDQSLPSMKGMSLDTTHRPATYIGGDFSYVTQIDDQLILCISDITGHGLEGTIFGLFVKGCIEAYLDMSSKSDRLPSKILEYLDQRVRKGGYPSEYAVAIFIMVVNVTSREAQYSAAGFQNPPLLIRSDGSLELLIKMGLPISPDVPPEVVDFSSKSTLLSDNDFVFLSTDGLYEQRLNEDSLYEIRLMQLLEQSKGLPSKTISDRVQGDFAEFLGEQTQTDDVSFVVLSTVDSAEYLLPSNFKSLDFIREEVRIYYKGNLECENFALAAHELVANAIEHGNHFDQGKSVRIHLTPRAIVVEDEGSGFDWETKKMDDGSLDSDSDRVRGITMVQMMASDLVYNRKGNRVSLIL